MPYRTYSSPGGQVVNGVAYIYDPSLVVGEITGNFRPAITSDFAANISVSGLNLTVGSVAVTGGSVSIAGGSVAVSNTAPIPISGVVISNATFDSTSIVDAQITGNNINVVGNTLLSGISGILVSNTQRSSWVTGQVSLTNTAPIAISGVVQTTTNVGNVAVTGGSINVSNNTPIPISGVVVTTATIGNLAVTGGSINVSNTAPIAISGVVVTNATFDSTSIVSAQVTGNDIATVSNTVLSGISGLLGSSLTDPAWVTGQISLVNTAPIAISGVVISNATFDSTSIVNAQITGNNINIITNSILSGISGLLSTTFTTAAWVTGDVGITNTAPIAISGVVQTTTTVGNVAVTGGFINVSNATPIPISGVVVTTATVADIAVTGGFINVSNATPIPISGVVVTTATVADIAVTGGFINVSNTAPIPISGVVVSSAAATPTTASTPAVSGINNAGWGVALGTNASRRGWGIQNLSTGMIRINFSATLPTTGAAHLFLKGGSAQNDGLGAAYIDAPAVYAGPVAVSGDFSVTPSYTIWEI